MFVPAALDRCNVSPTDNGYEALVAGFHTFLTFPTSSGPGLSVGSPGVRPDGVALVHSVTGSAAFRHPHPRHTP